MIRYSFPKRQWYLTPLLLLLLILVCGLQSCSKGSPQEPKSSGLAGSLWTEGTGTMLLDFVSDSEVRFTLTPSGSPRTMSYTTSYRLEGQTLYITDIIRTTPFGEAILLKDFRAEISSTKLVANFTTASVTIDPESKTPSFSPPTAEGIYLPPQGIASVLPLYDSAPPPSAGSGALLLCW